jgi:MFS family permease
MFYIAYIIFEIPSIVCCKYFGPGKWIPFISFGFGLLSLCTAFVHNFGQAAGVRFLLGVFEAGMLPGIAYYLSRWYRKSELAFRLSLYLTTAPLAGALRNFSSPRRPSADRGIRQARLEDCLRVLY